MITAFIVQCVAVALNQNIVCLTEEPPQQIDQQMQSVTDVNMTPRKSRTSQRICPSLLTISSHHMEIYNRTI